MNKFIKLLVVGALGGAAPGEEEEMTTATVTLTNDNIKNIPPSRFELIPAPGVGKVIVPISGIVVMHFAENGGNNVNYVAASTPQIEINIGENYASHYIGGIGWLTDALTVEVDKFAAIACPYIATGAGDYLGHFYSQALNLTGLENMSLVLRDDDNDGGSAYTGGYSGNSAKVTIIYQIITL